MTCTHSIWDEPLMTVHDVLKRASMLTGYPVITIISTSKAGDLFRLRAAIVFVARGLSGSASSYANIARVLQRDHSTIISAERRAIGWRQTDPEFRKLCDFLILGYGERSTVENLKPASPAPISGELHLRGFEAVIVRHDSGIAPEATPTLTWGHIGQRIILVMTAKDGTSLSAQIDVHQLRTMTNDLTEIGHSMSPRPPAERTLQ